MKSLDKLLKKSSSFLKEVSGITADWVQKLDVEKSRELVMYHPLTSGHMLRPLLVYMTAEAFSTTFEEKELEKLKHFAATVELMHNASLLHDDLLDNEEVRRKKPALHKVYGFQNALLAGNIYYIKAIELSNNNLEYGQTADLLKTAIIMCEGEILQASFEETIMPDDVYDKVIRYKTGSLTGLACRQAAAIMCDDERQVDLFGKLGEELGVMYQLRDDRKDKDTNLKKDYKYQDSFELCHNRILNIIEALSSNNEMKEFKNIVSYFKSSI